MQLLLVLAVLPVIYAALCIAWPFIFILYSIISVAEVLRSEYGVVGEYGLFASFTVLIIYSAKSSRYFWFGLLPLTGLVCLIART